MKAFQLWDSSLQITIPTRLSNLYHLGAGNFRSPTVWGWWIGLTGGQKSIIMEQQILNFTVLQGWQLYFNSGENASTEEMQHPDRWRELYVLLQ
jgi:hypothetical protein